MKKPLLFALFLGCFAQNLPAQFIREYNEATKKRGISDYEGTPIVPAEYDEVLPYFFENDTFFVAKNGNRKGVFDKKGRLTIPFDYEEVEIWAAQSQMQFGLVLVTKDRRANSGWGIVDARNGKPVLPLKFEFVRAIFPDLLVGRAFADSTLQFFDGQGKPLFQAFGRSVSPGFDENSVNIRRVDRSEYFVDKRGKPIFPSNLNRPQWTDGKRVICIENLKFGLVTMAGQVLIPFDWDEMKPMNPGQFWVRKRSGESGLLDEKGNFIIPLSPGGLYLPGGKPGPVYIRSDVGSDPNFNFKIYDSAGKLLFSDVRVSSVAMASELSNGPFNRREDYFSVELKGKKAQLVFHKTRGQILPTAWTSVWYGGEKHPLIAIQNDENGLPLSYKAFDLNGKLVFDAPAGMSLEHTRSPRLLIARIENRRRPALLNLDRKPEKTVFDLSSLGQMYNGYFIFEKDLKYGLLDPNGKMLVAADKFTFLGDPNKLQVKQFRETQTVRGKLVAVGTYDGVNYPSWVGVNERGESFVFGPPPPVEQVIADKPLEKPVETDAVVEMEASETAVPVLEEMPANPTGDEVFTMVEKKPEFPGGEAALFKFLSENLEYPPPAKENGIQGRVVLSFIVEKDGSLSDVKIVRDIGGGCGKEAIRLVQTMPKWTPGRQNGRAVRVKYTLPVQFKLD